MTRYLIATTLLSGVVVALPAGAGPNLGMKLACKRYGEAWNSGSRGALYGQVTGDFARQFQRMPHDMFRSMPRTGGGSRVLSSSKGRGSGRVTVATSQGVLTFVVVGRGFNWRVADIYKRGDDGRTISLKSYLDASLTAHEFIRDLKKPSGTQFYASTSRSFRSAFQELEADELQVVRDLIPDVKVLGKPYLSMGGARAVMHVRLTGDRKAKLQLVREGSWKVADYAVESPTMTIASFRSSLETIVSVQRFRHFMQEPKAIDPEIFTVKGSLQDSLVRVHELGNLPMKQKPSDMKHCTIDATGENVHIELADRAVRMNLDLSTDNARVTNVEVTMGNRWADLGHLIALNERARTTLAFVGLAQQPRLRAAAAVAKATTVSPVEEEESVLTNAVALETEPAPAVRPMKTDPAVVPATKKMVVSSSPARTTVLRPVSYTRYVQKPTYVYRKRYAKSHRKFRLFRRR